MPVPKDEVLELMRMNADPAELDEIRELWKEHSKAEDNRSIEGLLATLSEDCVYTVYPDDVSWHGHEGAARFYTELLTAFPDIVFELQNIVIGPQGVVEEAIVTGTHSGEVARQRADRRDDDLAERDLLPLGPGLAPLQGRARLHRHAEEGRMTLRVQLARRARRRAWLPQGPRAARRHGFRRQRRRLSAELPGDQPLPRHAGRALLRPQGDGEGARSRARSGSSGRAGSSTSSRRRRGGSRASATRSS